MNACPFCRSDDIEDCYVYMLCKSCGATGPQMNGGRNDDHADFVDHINAVKAWDKAPRILPANCTPEEYQKLNGVPWDDDAAVYYRISQDSEWEVDYYFYVQEHYPDAVVYIAGDAGVPTGQTT